MNKDSVPRITRASSRLLSSGIDPPAINQPLIVPEIPVDSHRSAASYPFGSAMRMGPGYFPIVLGGIMAALGLYVLVRGLIKNEKIAGVWAIRPLVLIVLGVVAFGFIMERLGMVLALITLFFLSTLGGHEFKFKEVLILSVVMTVLAWAVFIYGLGLNYRLFWWN